MVTLGTQMFDDRTSRNDPGDRINQPKIPVFTWLAWLGIIVVAALMLLNKQHSNTSAAPISQAEFLDKLDSNQIASATVEVNQQTMPLVEITGAYYEAGKDGKVTGTEIPFAVHNFLLSGEAENKLARSSQIVFRSPNTALASPLWSIAPFLILGLLFWFFFIRQIKARRPGA